MRFAECSVLVRVAGGASPGERRTLCVRPHALALEPPSADANAIVAKVVEVQWRGSAHRLYLEIDGIELRADCKPLREPPRRGERLTVHFTAHDATLLAER